MPLSPKQRAACESAGVEEVRAKMTYAGPGDGAVVPGLGDGLITRKDAANWLKEQSKRELIALKPTLWGVGIDLKAAFRSFQKWWRSPCPPPRLSERRHRGLARRLIAVCRALDVPAVAARPHPGRASLRYLISEPVD